MGILSFPYVRVLSTGRRRINAYRVVRVLHHLNRPEYYCMETCNTLYKPFLLGIFRDLCDLYPNDSQSSFTVSSLKLLSQLKLDEVDTICSIGKAVEKSLIFGSQLPIDGWKQNPCFSKFLADDGFPIILHHCFEELFLADGLPSWLTDDYYQRTWFKDSIVSRKTFDIYSSIRPQDKIDPCEEPVSNAEMQSKAMAVLAIRQLYLGLGKMRDWGRLRLRRGDRNYRLQVTRYQVWHSDRQLLHPEDGTYTSVRILSGLVHRVIFSV